MASILVVEDDPAIRSSLLRGLGEHGHAVASAPTGLAGVQAVVDGGPDVVLLDLGLPDVDGLDVLRMVRAVSQVPVIVVTARDGADVVRALDTGADDYVIKPFDLAQVEARVRAVLRRAAVDGDAQAVIRLGGLVVDPGARTVHLAGEPVELSRKEFDLLHALATRPGQVVTKRELLAEVWRLPYGGGERTVDVHLSWLRRKLGESAAAPRYLHSVRGVGIRLVVPDGAGG